MDQYNEAIPDYLSHQFEGDRLAILKPYRHGFGFLKIILLCFDLTKVIGKDHIFVAASNPGTYELYRGYGGVPEINVTPFKYEPTDPYKARVIVYSHGHWKLTYYYCAVRTFVKMDLRRIFYRLRLVKMS